MNKENNIRYFTYKIGKGLHYENVYFLCEWTRELKHINHGRYSNNNIENFTYKIKSLLYIKYKLQLKMESWSLYYFFHTFPTQVLHCYTKILD